jgi:3',5'-cyclic-AMP phosphodiesterase
MTTPEQDHKLVIQITDAHIEPAEKPAQAEQGSTPGVSAHTDTFETLRWILGTLSEVTPRPRIIVFSGDLADSGNPEAYRRARELVEPAARALGAQVMWVPGNHDKLFQFRRSMLDQEPSDAPLDQVLWDGDARVIGLDSSVPGRAYGELQDGQLEWLREELRTPAGLGTVLAIHHPPVDSPMLPFLSAISLRQPERLAEAVQGTDVRLIVTGHVHYAGVGMLGGIPVWIAPAAAYQTDLTARTGLFRGVTGSAFTRIDLKAGEVFASQVAVTRDETELYVMDTERMRELALAGGH